MVQAFGNDTGFYSVDDLHRGSVSQLALKPIAFRSISGKAKKRVSNFFLKSLLGEIMSRKYLMMQML